MIQKSIYIITGSAVILLLLVMGVWFFFFRTTAPASTTTLDTGGTFGTSVNSSVGVNSNTTDTQNINGTQPIAETGQVSSKKVFAIATGPIAGATLIQTLHPTTTLARYVTQNDGHVYDLPLDVPGAVPRIVSNVTIPGATRALWLEGGNATLLQYIDGSTIKSVYLGLSAATTSTKITTARIQFLPDNIIDVAASPDGASIVYLLKTSTGSDGYTARGDGTGAKKLFSLPLSQVLISWPSAGTLLAESKSAASVAGIVFSIDVKSGGVTPTLYALGVTANANPDFNFVIYQTAPSQTSSAGTYAHNTKSNSDTIVPYNPIPEKCWWSLQNKTTMYCAAALSSTPGNYLDSWHQGTQSVADGIIQINLTQNTNFAIATPGSDDGGVPSNIFEMALSPDEHYLSFTTKGSRTLWGVRLTQ